MKKEWIENLAIGAALLLFLSINGCVMPAKYYLANTRVTVKCTPDNGLEAEYESNKDQEGLEADLKKDCTGKISTVKSGTPTELINSMAKMQADMLAFYRELIATAKEFAATAAKAGAVSGS